MKRLFYILLALFLSFTVMACSYSKDEAEGDASYSSDVMYKESVGGLDGTLSGKTIDDITSPGEGEESKQTDGESEQIRAGQLTASALFDHDYYDFFKSLITKTENETGTFYTYQDKFKLNDNRIKLTFKGATDVKVELYNEETLEWTSYSDRNGVCYLFNSEERESYSIKVTYTNQASETKTLAYTVKNNDEITIDDTSTYENKIQIMFIIDTTGSMGDEISYLKSELKDVICKIATKNSSSVEVALMFYRDTEDEYTTKYFDFSANIDEQVKNLSDQYASGGGDFEEAVQTAFSLATTKQWLSSNATKIIVHVADAPSHDQDVYSWFTSVKNLAANGVRIISVASSGIDKLTEYLFREECLMTNGCYAFLTDDSGIGESHLEATVKEKLEVEYLNDLLVRVISGMHTGTYDEPINYKQVVK